MASFSPCSDLATREIRWISRTDQLKNGSRPSSCIHWGVSAVSIAAAYREAHRSDVRGIQWG